VIPVLLIPSLVVPTIALIQLKRILSGKRIAVLGAAGTGKSTLVTFLRDRRLPEPGMRVAPVDGKFILRLGKRNVECEVTRDMPGGEGHLVPESKEAFIKADFVLYLFRVDLLTAGDPETTVQVKTQLDTMKIWLDGDKFSKPRIVLVGTFADRVPGDATGPGNLRDSIASLNVIKLGRVKLGNPKVVVGSLDTSKGCAQLVYDITEALR